MTFLALTLVHLSRARGICLEKKTLGVIDTNETRRLYRNRLPHQNWKGRAQFTFPPPPPTTRQITIQNEGFAGEAYREISYFGRRTRDFLSHIHIHTRSLSLSRLAGGLEGTFSGFYSICCVCVLLVMVIITLPKRGLSDLALLGFALRFCLHFNLLRSLKRDG